MIWINSATVSYIPDVYRKNPEATATRLSNGFNWTARGVQAARNAARLDLNTRLVFNRNWSAFAGYSLEGRSKSLFHGVNLGASYSF